MNVSVIIPVYNAAAFVENATLSALQHEEVHEVILVEDGSTDDSLQICQKLESYHSKVKLIWHPDRINKGAGASRNLGLKHATSTYLCFLDADDYFTINRFQIEKGLFQSNLEIDGIYGCTEILHHDKVGADAWNAKWPEIKYFTLDRQITFCKLFDYLIGFDRNGPYSGEFHINSLIVKRQKLLQYNIFFEESLKFHQDTEFLWKCAYHLKLFSADKDIPVAVYRIHEFSRYAHHNQLDKTRALLFRQTLHWAKKNKLKKNYILHFELLFGRTSIRDVGLVLTFMKEPKLLLNLTFLTEILDNFIKSLKSIWFSNIKLKKLS